MKKVLTLFLFFFIFQNVYSQKDSKQHFQYNSQKLNKVIEEIETKFDIKYTYVDSIISQKVISIKKGKYLLEEINQLLENQTNLKFIKIDNRFYSILQDDAVEERKYLLDEIIVENFLVKGINKSNEKVSIFPQKIEALPGVTDADILLSLQQLPGVKSPNETATGLSVRGGTLDQNLILYDGIRLYHQGHLFGMISGINPNVEQKVNYYNKATNPRFGERISSIIDIKSTNKIEDKTRFNAGINALNVDAYCQTPIIKNKLGLQVSVRKSFTQWLQSPTFNQLAKKVFQNTNLKDFDDKNQFQFQDYSAKLNFKFNDKTEFSFTSILIDNDLDYKINPKNDTISNQQMAIKNYGFSMNWEQKYSSKLHHNILFFYSNYDFNYLKKKQYEIDKFDAFKKLNRIIDSGFELNYNYILNNNFNIDFGYQFFGNDISHLFNSFNQDVGTDISLRHLYNNTHVGYTFFKFNKNTFDINAGARYNYYNKIRSESFEPRVFIQKRFSNAIFLQTSYERKSQILSQVKESVANDLSLENYVWVLSNNNDYPIQKANQFTAGLIYRTKKWLLDIDLYYKTINGITSHTFGFLTERDSTIHNGRGFTKGLDVLLQKTLKSWKVWLTYTYQDSQNKYDNINNNQYFAINSDIKHAFNISFNKKWNNYSIALGWFWRTGKPYSLLNNENQFISLNSERLPNYHRLDISGIYQFFSTKNCSYKMGISIYNCYNQKNIISKEYEQVFANINDFFTPRYTIRNYYSLGINPNIFLRINF